MVPSPNYGSGQVYTAPPPGNFYAILIPGYHDFYPYYIQNESLYKQFQEGGWCGLDWSFRKQFWRPSSSLGSEGNDGWQTPAGQICEAGAGSFRAYRGTQKLLSPLQITIAAMALLAYFGAAL